jgi:transposase
MSKARKFPIKESQSELVSLRKKQTQYRIEKRIIWLLELQKGKFKTREALAIYLGISIRTQERWILRYISGGIDELLTDKAKNIGSRIITPEIHQGLSDRVSSSNNPFLGYWDAVQWVKKQYKVDVQYHNLRRYLIKHFKTKLKSPRKSHYKKDDKAVEAFLKTS